MLRGAGCWVGRDIGALRSGTPRAISPCMTNSTPFHVYAIDGFESAHRSVTAAIRAAKRGAKLRGVLYTVVRCSASGHTGAGNGTEVWASNGSVARG